MNFTAINLYLEASYQEHINYGAPYLEYNKETHKLSISLPFNLPYAYFKPENAKELDHVSVTYDNKTLTLTQSHVDFDGRNITSELRSFINFCIKELIVNSSFYDEYSGNWDFGYAYELLNVQEYPPHPPYIEYFRAGEYAKYVLDESVHEHLIETLWDLFLLFDPNRWNRLKTQDFIVEFLIHNGLLTKPKRMTDKTEMNISELLQHISDNNIQKGNYQKIKGTGGEGVYVLPNEIKIRGRAAKDDLFYINE